MAAIGVDYDQLFKSLIYYFTYYYLELFHPDILAVVLPDLVVWLDPEMWFDQITGNTRRYGDIVGRFTYKDPDNLPFPFKGTEYLVLGIEPEKGTSVSDLRPRMPFYFHGMSAKHPKAYCVLTALYIDVALGGLGTDAHNVGTPLAYNSGLTRNFNHHEWPKVGLAGLDAEEYIPKAKTNLLVPGLIGFMDCKPHRRPELVAEAILHIDSYKLPVLPKQLLVRALLVGMDLNDDETKIFESLIKDRINLRRVDSVIQTWYEQGQKLGYDQGQKQGYDQGSAEALQRLTLIALSNRFNLNEETQKTIKSLKPEQLEALFKAQLDPNKTLKDLGLANGAASVS